MEFDGTLRNIQLILSLMILGLCVFGGVTLLAHPRRSRAKSILGAGMLLWGGLIVFRVAGNPWLDSSKPLFQPLILIIGGFGMAVTTCYIIEILRPGFLTFRRFILFLSPVIVCSLLFGVYYVYRRQMPVYYSPRDLLSFSDIDILFRGALIACNILYMLIPSYLTIRDGRAYSAMLRENVSDPENYDLRWLQRIMLILSTLYVFYLVLLFTHNTLLYVIDKAVILVLWYYFFYRALFLKEVPWRVSFRAGWRCPDEGADANDTGIGFLTGTNYVKEIEQWFREEKPYLRGDLRLSDLQRRFPIGRTYLSQLFNKALGVSFSDYVNRFRVEESRRLLETDSRMTIDEIAELAGFNSTSAFRRAFAKCMEVSPSEYRKRYTSSSPGR